MEIVYNCELGGMYRSMRKHMEDHNTQSRREAAAAKRLTTPQQEVLTFPMVEQRLMQQHMAKVMRTGVVYSCPKSVVRLDYLSDVLDEPATKRARTEVGSAPWLQSSVDAAGEEQAATGLDTLLFFRLAFANAGKKKQMRIPVGVGGRVKQGDVMVTVHDAIAGASDSPIVSSRPAGTISGPTCLLQDWSLGALPEIKTQLVEYASSETHWCIRDRVSKRASPATTCDILTRMVTVGAVAECLPSEGLAIDASDSVVRRAVQELIDEHIVEEMQQGRLRFTRHGQAQVSTCNALAGPSCVFAPPSHAMDLTKLVSYQLVRELLEDGWEWRLWVAPGRRPKSMRIPPGYKIGEPKLWFSTRDVPRHYLLALLQASSLADRGLTCIPHGQDESYYKDLLDADRPFKGASPHPPLEVPAALLDMDMAGSEDEGVADADGAHAGAAPGDEPMQESDAESVTLALERVLEEHLAEQLQAPDPAPSPATPEDVLPDLAPPTPLDPAPLADPLGAGSTELPPPPPMPGGPPRPPRHLPGFVVQLESSWIGAFRFTARMRAIENAHGAFSVRCIWHRRNDRTDCKKDKLRLRVPQTPMQIYASGDCCSGRPRGRTSPGSGTTCSLFRPSRPCRPWSS